MDSGNQQQHHHLGLAGNTDSWASPHPWDECLHSSEILGDLGDWAAQEVGRAWSGESECRRDEAVKASRSLASPWGWGAGPSTEEMAKQAGSLGSKKVC